MYQGSSTLPAVAAEHCIVWLAATVSIGVLALCLFPQDVGCRKKYW